MFFDIGPLEFLVIVVVGVLIVGPERLPKMLAEGLKWISVLRVQATNARRELATAADLSPNLADELRGSASELAELHPRRLVASLLDDITSVDLSAQPERQAPPAPITESAVAPLPSNVAQRPDF